MRYEWPADPTEHDDPSGRAGFRAVLRPAASVVAPSPDPAGTVARAAAPVAARRGRRSAAPVGAPPSPTGVDLWLPIGPSVVVNGQSEGDPNVSGRIRDLQVDVEHGSDRVYAASAGGGVWFSPDAGRTWRPLNEFTESPNRGTVTPVGAALACGSLHVRFGATAADDEVWVGTGEPSRTRPGGNPGGNLVGVGILTATGPAANVGWAVEAGSEVLRGKYVWRLTGSPLDSRHVFAATSDGVYHRPPGKPWSRLGTIGSEAGDEPVDILVTRETASRLRVWVTTWAGMHRAALDLPLTDPPATVTFTSVDLPSAAPWTNKQLAVSGTTLWVLGRRAATGDEKFHHPHLWRIDASAASPSGTSITGLPDDMFGGAGHDQSHYDMCIAAHPVTATRLFVGGSIHYPTPTNWVAALFRVDVAGTVATPTWVGRGVHADLHVLRIGPEVVTGLSVRSVWTGCDGGVFRSFADGDPGSWSPRNSNLATLEPGYVACHPTNDGIVAAGMQDNGTCVRVGDVAWRLRFGGDGGGTVFDPSHDNRFVTQYVRAKWQSSDGTMTPPVLRHPAASRTSAETDENDASLFYSGASALAHGGTDHVLLGTNRLWYTGDWGTSWVTVPSGRDPRRGSQVDLEIDRLDRASHSDDGSLNTCSEARSGPVISTRLSPADSSDGHVRVRAHGLWAGGLELFLGTKPTAPATAWTWTHEIGLTVRAPSGDSEKTVVENGVATSFLPAGGLVTDVAVHDPARGAHGSCYVTTVGGAEPTIDTVFWFDGDRSFYPCGVRNRAPVGRGVWSEVPLVAPAMAAVVDVVGDDRSVVYVGTSIGVIRGVLSFTNDDPPLPTWSWRHFDRGLPETAVNDLAIHHHGDVRLLRAALHGRGVYEIDLTTSSTSPRTYLRVYPSDTRRRRPVDLGADYAHGEDDLRFDASPDIFVEDTVVPPPDGGLTEAMFFELGGTPRSAPFSASRVRNETFKVHVLVHHRWPFEAAPPTVRVVLLRKDLAAGVTDPALDGIWPAIVSMVGAPAPSPLPGGWALVGGPQPLAGPVDALRPRSTTFDVDLTGHGAGDVMFLAVVLSDGDQVTANEHRRGDGTACVTVQDLVLLSRHVAARSVRLAV